MTLSPGAHPRDYVLSLVPSSVLRSAPCFPQCKLFYSVTASSSEWAKTSAAVDQTTFNLIEVVSGKVL